ncbi:hypothetical protein DV738_g1381, partial [Chaetothyriales sp. CBS 135597]
MLDLSWLPAIYILSAHLPTEDLHDYEDQVFAAQGNLTYDPKEARIFLARISQKKRAAYELRSKGIWTEEDTAACKDVNPRKPRKRRRLSEAQSTLDASSSDDEEYREASNTLISTKDAWPDLISHVLVIKMEWLDACVQHNRVLPYQPQLVYYAKLIPRTREAASMAALGDTTISYIRATPPTTSVSRPQRRLLAYSGQPHRSSLKRAPARPHRTTTPERELLANAHSRNGNSNSNSQSISPSKNRLPPLPAWASGPHASYSCCRSTRMDGPNKAFLAQLLKIKESRVLTLDSVGVRAYSAAIASLSAYTYPIRHSAEIIRLPSCNEKICSLWQEWHDSATAESERFIAEVRQLEADADLGVLRMLYNIWGVGPDVARRFYFSLGWKDLDDIIESGWHTLSRVQQIGVKYYDEFREPIARAEVESIAATIKQHARLAASIPPHDFNTDADIEVIIVGGYRRGKAANGDVDVIITHRDPFVTSTDLIIGLISSLEEAAFITHTLRDIRRFANKEKGWKFDSSGVRADYGRGPVLDYLELPRSPRPVSSPRSRSNRDEEWEWEWEWKDDWASRERRLMEGLGIGWRPPEERCTG